MIKVKNNAEDILISLRLEKVNQVSMERIAGLIAYVCDAIFNFSIVATQL